MLTKTQRSRTQGGSEPATIGFRLDEEPRRVLAERAAGLGVSPHALARQYVLEILGEGEERVALHHALKTLIEEAGQTHESLALGIEALLSSAGKVSEDNARAWVDQHLK